MNSTTIIKRGKWGKPTYLLSTGLAHKEDMDYVPFSKVFFVGKQHVHLKLGVKALGNKKEIVTKKKKTVRQRVRNNKYLRRNRNSMRNFLS